MTSESNPRVAAHLDRPDFGIYGGRGPAKVRGVHPPKKRLAGILIPAFSPRREGDLGIGDTLALREWIDWAAEHHVGFIQLLADQ